MRPVTRCAVCRTRKRLAHHGQLCHHHYDQLTSDLADVELLLHLVHDMTIPSNTGERGNHRGKPVTSSAPVVLDAIAATDWRTRPEDGDQLYSVTGLVAHWSDQLTTAMRLVTPENPDAALIQITTHLAWFTHQPTVTTFTADMHNAATMLRRIAGETKPPIGRHAAPHPDAPDQECGGRLYPLPHSFGVRCIDCGETYDGHQELRRLGLVLNDQRHESTGA